MRKIAVSAVLLATAVGVQAAIVMPVGVISEEYVFISANNTINNAGMLAAVNGGDSLDSALLATHRFGNAYDASFVSTSPGGDNTDFFANIGTDTDVDIVFDLTGGGNTTVGSILLWNYENNGGGGGRYGNQTRSLEVRLNTEAQGSSTFSAAPISINLLPVVDADSDPSNDLGGTNSAQWFTLGQEWDARYVQVSLTDNYRGFQGISGGDRVGLGEVRFASEVPEPAAGLIVALGAGLVAAARRRQA